MLTRSRLHQARTFSRQRNLGSALPMDDCRPAGLVERPINIVAIAEPRRPNRLYDNHC